MTEAGKKPQDFSALSALVVDDNANMRRLILTLLRAIRITNVREAASGMEALMALADHTPDVIITDLAMKPVDGIDFVRKLRADARSPAQRVPVIMLTGHSDAEMVVRARDAGIHDFIVKPVSARQLEERIERIMTTFRPFVETPVYTGPDRRLRRRDYGGPERRHGRPKRDGE